MDTGTQNLSEGSFFKDTWGNFRNAIIGCIAAILFGLAVLLSSIFSATEIAGAYESAMVDTKEELVAIRVEYYLPYPGVLPDSPMYKIKMLRDGLKRVLTFGEVNKAELELLFADKRINAAWTLMEGGKGNLAVTTATKAEKYLETSVKHAVVAFDDGKDTKSLLSIQIKAVAKHLEILDMMIQKTTGSDKNVLEKIRTSTQILAEKLSRLDLTR